MLSWKYVSVLVVMSGIVVADTALAAESVWGFASHEMTSDGDYSAYKWAGLTYHTYSPKSQFANEFYTSLLKHEGSVGGAKDEWTNQCWAQAYSAYYVPEAGNVGGDRWITDRVIEDYLSADHAAATLTGEYGASSASATITADVKEELRFQVGVEIAAHRDRHAVQVKDFATDGQFLFVVADELDVTTNTGSPCMLSGGDVISLVRPIQASDVTATVTVVAAKGNSCAATSIASISILDLTILESTFAEHVENAMVKIADAHRS